MAARLRVLLVEDNPDDAELMLLHLAAAGIEPDWQRVETEADYVAALESPPDLILSDWSLPHFGGPRALQLLTERGLDIPFIIVSGSIGEEMAIDALRNGAQDYVLKDRPARLSQAVLRALEDKQQREARLKAEQEREKLAEQLVQSQKMESVGRLAGGVAHDFNNMLSVILGHAELAQEMIDQAHPVYASLEEIRKAGQRSADLTRQLLAFARKQTVAPRVLDLNDNVTGMLDMLQRLIGESIELSWVPGADLWPIRIDPSQVDQILTNLCVNARDAIGGVGTISIETEDVTLDEDYCALHMGCVPGQYVRLTISDSGCGMDGQTLQHAFEPFYTTKPVGEGTGLGLATVYGIVKQNNGFVHLYSELGQGTTVTIHLPRYVGRAREAQSGLEPEPTLRGQETILLVEDEPAILNLATQMLCRLGYTVIPAAAPGEAIALARAHVGEIHLLVTDVIMPEMNGRDLAKNLLALYPAMQRLFMSGYTSDIIAHQGVLAERVHFIQKPFTLKALSSKVREVLDQG